MTVSIIIKAFNEERRIAATVESALGALSETDGEVIVADGGSTDRTLEIAARYPVRVVRLARPEERSCGAGPQLGYQYARGALLCLIDGDMVLHHDFIRHGQAFLAANPGTAGVAGAVAEINVENLEFARRTRRVSDDLRPGPVDRLNGGGLYRRAAIESVGHFSDRNLHAYEELDLALRLAESGWTLHRLDRPFVAHYGHTINAYRLLWRRCRSRYVLGLGELLRAAAGRGALAAVARPMTELRLWFAVYAWWLAMLFAVLLAPNVASALLLLASIALAPVALMILRTRSLRLGVYSTVAWNAHALGLAIGFLRPRRAPGAWIDSSIAHDGTQAARPRVAAG